MGLIGEALPTPVLKTWHWSLGFFTGIPKKRIKMFQGTMESTKIHGKNGYYGNTICYCKLFDCLLAPVRVSPPHWTELWFGSRKWRRSLLQRCQSWGILTTKACDTQEPCYLLATEVKLNGKVMENPFWIVSDTTRSVTWQICFFAPKIAFSAIRISVVLMIMVAMTWKGHVYEQATARHIQSCLGFGSSQPARPRGVLSCGESSSSRPGQQAASWTEGYGLGK